MLSPHLAFAFLLHLIPSLAQQPAAQKPIQNTNCLRTGLPEYGCYLPINRTASPLPSAWGAYLDISPDPASVLTPAVLPNLPDTCILPMNLLCAYISQAEESLVRGYWVWALSPGPGCLAAVYLPVKGKAVGVGEVELPRYDECRAYVDVPMREVLAGGIASGGGVGGVQWNRVSVNSLQPPAFPPLENLMQSVAGQKAVPILIEVPGGSVNESLSSWFMTSYTYIPITPLPQQSPPNMGTKKGKRWGLDKVHKKKIRV